MEITDVNTLFGAYPSHHAESNPETLAAAMGDLHIDYCLTLSTVGLFFRDTDGNAETLQACQSHDHLIPVATVNPRGYWGQPELIAQIADSGFEMFRFFPHLQGWPLEFAPFQAVLKILAERPRMPIMVETTQPGDITVLARLTADYPHPVIWEGVNPANLAEAAMLLRETSNRFLETHALQSPDALPFLRDTVGIDRVLFGSRAPGLSLASALAYVQHSSLSDEDQQAVLGGNTQKIWHQE